MICSLGTFLLGDRIGRGGMADVYRAEHVGPGGTVVPVAVKVITATFAKDPRFVASLENEVQAVARLDHPGIVRVLDYGRTDEAAQKESGGALTAGSPFLVMELASGGTLSRARRPLSFRDFYPILRELLSALGHAHARGVVHRDLKPDNVLIASSADSRPGMKLTDFGIAKAHELDSSEGGGGTPSFMAPEQFFGRKADAGPWTDLYALGCFAFFMSSGRLPFKGAPAALAMAHATEEPPPLQLVDYPPEFEAWVRCLLQKEPRDRFQRAADADHELQALSRRRRRARDSQRPSDPGRTSEIEAAMSPSGLIDLLAEENTVLMTGGIRVSRPATSSDPMPSSTHLATLPATADEEAIDQFRARLVSPRIGPTGGLGSTRAVFPSSWRERQRRERRLDLVGAGLGLFGLRELPMVGREAARDLLWASLGEAARGEALNVVVVEAEAGQGKTRLMEWLAALAHEVGAANILRATHGISPSTMDGLPRMLARHLQVVGLSPAEVLLRVQDWLASHGAADPHEAWALAELMAPSGNKPSKFREAKERHRLVDRVLEIESRDRAVLVMLDDAQWGHDSLEWVQHALRRGTHHRVSIVLSVRTDQLRERGAEATVLTALKEHTRTKVARLDPLDLSDTRRLVEDLLGLDPIVARRVAERAQGNPMFAVQLVGDWVQRGALAPTEHGFKLARAEELDAPDDVYALWSARVAPVVQGRPKRLRALAMAAVIGRDVVESEWLLACDRAGDCDAEGLLPALMREGFTRRIDGGFSFAHVLLRDTIVRAARKSGRFEELSRVLAKVLAEKALEGSRVAERAGRHYLDAGDFLEAARWLLAGSRERWYLSDYVGCRELVQEHERALKLQGHGESDVAFLQGWLLSVELCLRTDEVARGIALAEQAERIAHLAGESRALAEARRLLATAAYQQGRFDASVDLFHRARTSFDVVDDVVGRERCRIGLGDVTYRMGDLDAAGAHYAAALGPLQKVGAVEYVADALYGLGYVAMWKKRYDEARECFMRELEIFEALGDRFGIARVNNSLGEVARLTEQYAEAEERYRKTLLVCEALDLPRMRSVVMINLGLVLIGLGKDLEAEAPVREGHAAMVRSGSRGDEAAILGAVLVIDAARGEFDAWDADYARLATLIDETAKADGDLAWELEQASDRAARRGEKSRARAALHLAEKQWLAIGRPDAAEAARSRRSLLG